jgi:hypothetical protein
MKPPLSQMPRGSRVTGKSREDLGADLKARYEAGASIRDLMNVTGRSYGFVYRVLEESGVQFRSRGGRRKRLT